MSSKVTVLRGGQIRWQGVFEEDYDHDDAAAAVEDETHEGFITQGDVIKIAGANPEQQILTRGGFEYFFS